MAITEKGPGDQLNYPMGKIKSLKKMMDGNPFPYELEGQINDGVFGEEKADGFNSEKNYTPRAKKQIGDEGLG